VNSTKQIVVKTPSNMKRIPITCVGEIMVSMKMKDNKVVIGDPRSSIEVAVETLIYFNPL